MKLKICGMKYRNNILEVMNTMPDYIGFIFYRGSPRYVGDKFDMPHIPEKIKKVGVFVNEDFNIIEKIAGRYNLDFIQLHGEESVTDCRKLKGVAGLIKAFSIDNGFDFEKTKRYVDEVDFFLFDTKGQYYGGNGKNFDWRKLIGYNQERPFFLSGGLTPENMDQLPVLKGMNLHALDVNSGVEIEPGLKDIQKIRHLNLKLRPL